MVCFPDFPTAAWLSFIPHAIYMFNFVDLNNAFLSCGFCFHGTIWRGLSSTHVRVWRLPLSPPWATFENISYFSFVRNATCMFCSCITSLWFGVEAKTRVDFGHIYITLRTDAFPGMIARHVQGPQGRRSFEHCASVERFDHVARCVLVCFVRVCCLAFCFDHTLYCLFSPAAFYFPSWPATPDFSAFLLGVICFILPLFFVSSSVFVVSCSSLSASMVRFIRSTFPFITNNGTRCGVLLPDRFRHDDTSVWLRCYTCSSPFC